MPRQAKRQRQKEGRAQRQAAAEAARRRAARRRQLFTTVVIFALVVGLVAFISGRSSKQSTKAVATTVAAAKEATAPCPAADGSSPRTDTFNGTPRNCTDPARSYLATFATDAGTFEVALDPKKAPRTVNNFVFLARYHVYDNTPFFRAVPDFVVQGGDPKDNGTGDAGYRFADELPASVNDYKAGSAAMANSGPNTNGSQFFVVVSDNGGRSLGKPAYSLFGQVTAGLDVVQRIAADGAPDPGPPKVVHRVTTVTIKEL